MKDFIIFFTTDKCVKEQKTSDNSKVCGLYLLSQRQWFISISSKKLNLEYCWHNYYYFSVVQRKHQ